MIALIRVTVIGVALLTASAATAAEFYMGEPVVKEGMQFSPAYLTGIEMDRHPPGMDMSPDAIHIEIDIHATKDETHGFPEDAWIPYLTVNLTVEKEGGSYKETKQLAAMEAKDGPHYANNFKMDGPGTYKATYAIDPPSKAGFIRHVDKATGVPAWWQPITLSWTFQYPSTGK
ncbi:iron transporter [Chelatococcus reniformis]|uniref:Membrane protein n=1 Tax=Chelatococcus reniformis TaxID=1494448 RepID=A0A916U8L6_9HYPH|nr:iron transporter [Chelatococcus reniformis]GGC64633.1 membrane protein [Chelatococcus reniformis]